MRRFIGFVLFAVLAGCGSSTVGAPAGGASPGGAGGAAAAGANATLPADPCATLTLDELKSVTGKTFQPGVKSNTADCTWTQQGGNGVVEVDFKPLDKDVFGVLAKGSANIPVPGVGDQALIVPLISVIDVAKGGVEFTVQPILISGGDWKHIATDLAKLVVGRL